ncbi:kelch repeat-containing protein [Nibrella viscosa]|uniref:Kelch repeat-containing protein n=1 Tax=Nibrella viscosa TaxID=1084524 RepID=A0ABP8KRX3_9BACT
MPSIKPVTLIAVSIIAGHIVVAQNTPGNGKQWEVVQAQNEPQKRTENAFARVGDLFYLVGGRTIKPVEAYDPKKNLWEKRAVVPVEMHHFQAVEHNGEIYVAGAFMGNYPHEIPIPALYIYNPKKDEWRKGADIPEDRRRGSAGVAAYRNKIYLFCGIIDGHFDGHVSWVDEYDPAKNSWTKLPDAPHARDHFQAAVHGDKAYIAGGRLTSAKTGKVINQTVSAVDVYDFKNQTWMTLPEADTIPTRRAGSTSIPYGNKILVIGGESDRQKKAHNQTEVLDTKTLKWETWAPMQIGRHATQAIIYKNNVYIVAGTGNQGGSPELNSMEVMK